MTYNDVVIINYIEKEMSDEELLRMVSIYENSVKSRQKRQRKICASDIFYYLCQRLKLIS